VLTTNRSPLTTIIILLVAGATTASADDLLGLYAGGSVGEAHVRSVDDLSAFSTYAPPLRFDDSHLAWKVFAGIRPITSLGVEVGYTDFGRVSTPLPPCFPSAPHTAIVGCFVSDNAKQSAESAFAMGYLPLPIPFLDVYGKAGVARLHTQEQATIQPITACPAKSKCGPFSFGQNQWSTDFAYGAGVQAKLGSFAVRAEYERINASGGNPDLFSLGASWTF
jgi:opacity protein-like surface antigen